MGTNLKEIKEETKENSIERQEKYDEIFDTAAKLQDLVMELAFLCAIKPTEKVE